MAKELFDKVDENDNIIGTTHKEEAHEKGYVHRVAAVYVFDAEDRLYVQEHIKANMLDHSVGGHVSQGESFDEAAKREAAEELNLYEDLNFVGSFYSDERYTGSNYRHMFGLYTCTPSDNWQFEPNDEVKVITPVALNEIVDRMNRQPQQYTPGFLNSMEYYLEKTNSPLSLNLSWYKNKAS